MLGQGLEFIEFPRTQRLLVFSNSISGELANRKIGVFDSLPKWGYSTKGYPTITARTNEGLIINMDILISYKLTTSNDDSEKA